MLLCLSPQLAQSGRSEPVCYLSAFGVKRTNRLGFDGSLQRGKADDLRPSLKFDRGCLLRLPLTVISSICAT